MGTKKMFNQKVLNNRPFYVVENQSPDSEWSVERETGQAFYYIFMSPVGNSLTML